MTTEGQGAIGKEEDAASINSIEETKRGPGKNSQLICYQCGKTRHVGKDPSCPTRSQSCGKCGLEGHFQERCKTKTKTKHKRDGGKRKTKRLRDPKSGTANMVDIQDDEDYLEYAFVVCEKSKRKLK